MPRKMKLSNVIERAVHDGAFMSSTVTLYDYQLDVGQRIVLAYDEGCRRVAFTLPTGTGKTIVMAWLIRRWLAAGKRILFLARAKEILEQAAEAFESCGVARKDISLIKRNGSRAHPRENARAPIQVASVQTLVRRSQNFVADEFDVIMTDECHHDTTPGCKKIVARYPNALRLGASATPYGSAGQGLRGTFDQLIVGAKPSELYPRYMTKWEVWSPPAAELDQTVREIDLVKVGAGNDYQPTELAKVVRRTILYGNVIAHCQIIGVGLPTVVYALTREYAAELTKKFRHVGIPAEMVDGETPDAEREQILKRLASGKTTVVVNCMVLLEGWDCPAAKRIVICRPTRSLRLFVQMCGRGGRPGVDCIVLDHTGAGLRFGNPHDDRNSDVTLDGLDHEFAEPRLKACSACGFDSPVGVESCEKCGVPFPREEAMNQSNESQQPMMMIDGHLVPLDQAYSIQYAKIVAQRQHLIARHPEQEPIIRSVHRQHWHCDMP